MSYDLNINYYNIRKLKTRANVSRNQPTTCMSFNA